MGYHRLRSWLNPLRGRRTPAVRTASRPKNIKLTLERFEDRTVPSTTIPLNANTWTGIGPAPVTFSQAPGFPSSTGRLNGVAVDPTDTNVIYVAADTGGIWRTTDGGKTWSPRTDQQQLDFQTIAMVHRDAGNTVYAFDQMGNLYTSTDGATTFVKSSPFPVGAFINKLTVVTVDPLDPTKDELFAAVGTIFGVPPGKPLSTYTPPPAMGVPAGGIWRSQNGGATWKNIVDPTVAPFTTNPAFPLPTNSLAFSDVAVNPTNPNIVYAAVGNAFGDPSNGVYRTNNAQAATPTWTLLIGGSTFVPGETPGNIKLAISPTAPSVVFASITLRIDPQILAGNGAWVAPLLGVFRTVDSGANWAPVLTPDPANSINDLANFMGLYGYDNNVIMVAPNGSTNPMAQTVYVAGYGLSLTNTVLISTNSGTQWTLSGTDASGTGTYPNVHQGAFDSQGRLIVATGGGIYRLDGTKPLKWESLNGTSGPAALDVADFSGFALDPTDPNSAIGNISYLPTLLNAAFNPASKDATGKALVVPTNYGPAIQDAVMFTDTGSTTAGAAYGWQVIDANGIDNNVGVGQVFYNPSTPSIVYRTVPDDGTGNFIRVSGDGGVTWQTATAGFQADPYPKTVPLGNNLPSFNLGSGSPSVVIDPSQPNRLFGGFTTVQVSDNYGLNWGSAMQVGTQGGTVPIPDLPTKGAKTPIPITAIGVGRYSGITLGGSTAGVNGVAVFAATTNDVMHDSTTPDDDATSTVLTGAAAGPQLFVTLVPTNVFPFPGTMVYDNHAWSNITPRNTAGVSLLKGNIEQIIVDPANNSTLYVITTTGQVLRGTNFSFSFQVDATTGVIFGGAPDKNPVTGAPTPLQSGKATWTDISGNLPPGTFPSATSEILALDSQVLSDPADDTLYAAAASGGVWQLSNPSKVTAPVWKQVGLDPVSGKPSIPAAPITAISLNTTTGILGAATYGRGVYEIQVRGLVSGHVFTDTNGNGVFDPGEPALPNVTVEVLDENQNGAVIAATTTDAKGFYEFRSLTGGNFQVVALAGAGQVQTTTPGNFPTFTEQNTTTLDIGFFKPGSIAGTTFNDLNNDGVREAGEVGVTGFTVFLDANNNGVLDAGETSIVSGANGAFTLANLGPAVILGAPNPATFNGTYLVREAPPSGWVQTTPLLPAIALTTAEAVTGQLIGNIRISSIAGTAFLDSNADGVQQAGDPGAVGFTIQLVGPGGTQTTTTGAGGSYSFVGLAPGTYTLTEVVPAGYTQTTTNPAPITVAVTDHITGVSFGIFQNVSLSGQTFNDANGNGALEAGDVGLGGFVLDLVNPLTNTVVASVTSGVGGAFSFPNVGPLPGGTKYAIVEEPRTGYVQTTTNPPAFAPASGINQSSFLFGNFQRYAVSGTAYVDVNGNGAQDAGDVGAAGFVIQVLNTSNAVVGTATTAADGTYTVAGIGPGAYTVVEFPRPGYLVTQGAAGYPLAGLNDVNVPGQDFGNLQVSSISGTAFVDTNGNGVQDSGDIGGAGFTVQLNGPGGPQTTVSLADGSYQFNNLAAGTYTVIELPRTGYTQTTAAPPPVTVAPSGIVTGISFGAFQNVTLGGQAFNDANGNGVQNAGETGVAGFVIDLVNPATNAIVATATTGSSGTYTFTNVGPLPGGTNYTIVEEPRTGYVQTTANPAAFAPASGTNQTSILFGNFQKYAVSGTAYLDANGNGVQDSGDVGAAGFLIQLFNSSNVLVGSATSAANGAFSIPNIGPGAYSLVEAPRTGYQITQGSAGISLPGTNDINVTGQNFGNALVASISGTAFVDQNGNGVLDAADTGAAGFTIQLTGPGGTQTVVSAADGSYSFTHLTAGAYTITEQARAGYTQTTAAPATITVGVTDNITGVTFGNFQTVSLGGEVFKDTNSNGVLDSGEAGFSGVVVNLINAATNAVVATTTSGTGGAYSFATVSPLPGGGAYLIREVRPIGFAQTTTNPPAFAPISGSNVSTLQFGNGPVKHTIVTSADAGAPSAVTVRDATTDAVVLNLTPYPGFTGGARVATGFFSGGTAPDIVTGAGPGGGPHIKVFNGATGATIASFFAFDATFTGGVYVATGDVNGDGVSDIVVGADAGGGPHVKVFDGAALLTGHVTELASFFAYNAGFTGGVRVAAADIDGDGRADIITGAGPGGGPHVEVFSGKTGAQIRSFFAYSGTFTGGVYVAAGDVSGSGQQDIITGAGIGGGPHVRVFDGATSNLLNEAFGFPAQNAGNVWTSGVRVATTDINADGKVEIIVTPGSGQQPLLRVLDGLTLAEDTPPGQLVVSDLFFLGGIFVGGD